jgi:MFS family permease
VVIVPGLICATLLKRFVHEPVAREVSEHDSEITKRTARGHPAKVLAYRNVWLCCLIFCFFVAFAFLGWTFLPLYLLNIRHYSSQQMSVLMSVLGVSGLVFGIGLPVISDRAGRKPVMIAGGLMGLLCPLACIYYAGSIVVLGLLLFAGWALAGIGALTVATIPAETVPTRSIATAIGLVIAVGFLVGGLAGPTIGGWSADHWGLRVALLLQAGCAAAIALASLFLRESAPLRIETDGGASVPELESRRSGLWISS